MINNFFLYFFTIKNLQLKQIIYRIFYLIYFPSRPKVPKKITIRDTELSKFFWLKKTCVYPKGNNYLFLNTKYKICKLKDLQILKIPKLWLYNFHYFDYLNTNHGLKKYSCAERLILSWILFDQRKNKIGWEPYPTSLRIVNWIKWSIILRKNNDILNNSLYIQSIILSKKVEWHINANHLIANAKALIFSGVYIKNEKFVKIRVKGELILSGQLDEQILNDGGHFERSPMYHSIILEDLLDILELDRIYPKIINPLLIKKIKEKLPKMLLWLNTMKHPDGEISFFNDSCKNIAQSPAMLNKFFHNFFSRNNKLKKSNDLNYNYLKNTEFISIKNKKFKGILDIGSINPQYQPGHSHAQTFCFELSFFGQRVFVNTGVSQYENNKRRSLERSTSAHNTFLYDGQNSSEIWSSFRVARRAKAFNIKIKNESDELHISACHDGYTRFNKKLVHNREWIFSSNNIFILDKLHNNNNCCATLILEPDIKFNKIKNQYILQLKSGNKIILSFNQCKIELIDWLYAPSFGVLLKTKCLKIFPKTTELLTEISW